MAKKTKAEEWGETPFNYNQSVDQLRKTLKWARYVTQRRIASLERNKSFSFAREALERQLAKTYLKYTFKAQKVGKGNEWYSARTRFSELPNINTMKYQQLEKELAFYHKFWASPTATVAGAKEEQKKQSARIFGKDVKGRPRRMLTLEEGRLFWAAYARFKETYKETTQYDSRRVLRLLGEHMGEVLDVDTDWVEFLENFYQEVEADYNHTQFNDAPIDWDEVYEE